MGCPRARSWGIVTAVSSATALSVVVLAQPGQPTGRRHEGAHDPRMSAMGMAASNERRRLAAGGPRFEGSREDCVNDPRCAAGLRDDPAGTQSELSIAVDTTGQHVVVGFNDFRGFAANPVSVSGFMYSDDGGQTFVDGGQLPSPGNESVGGTRLPMVFGDPEIEYVGGCTFIYSSILVKKFSPTAAVQRWASTAPPIAATPGRAPSR